MGQEDVYANPHIVGMGSPASSTVHKLAMQRGSLQVASAVDAKPVIFGTKPTVAA